MKNNKLLLLAALVILLPSCSDMLETESEYVEFEKDNTLNHPTDSVYSVLGIIGKMQIIADRTVLFGEVRGDLVTPTEAASADLKRLANFEFAEDNKYNAISDYYAVINNCNYYLAHVDTALQRRGRNLFRAEYAAVKSFRAWTYLQLAMAYGQVPLVTDPVMTEKEAREAMNLNRSGITEICQYFINDLTPYAEIELPRFGDINNFDSQQFFIPMKALLGDLCLWAGMYKEAAKWYHDYLTDKRNPIQINYSNRIVWPSATEFVSPVNGYSTTSNTQEVLSFIPMEERVFDGVVSDLSNIYNSTQENNNYFQITPSQAMYNISAAQTYCLENKTATTTDTIYVPKTGLYKEIMAGDLRFYSNYNIVSVSGQDKFSEYGPDNQTFRKITARYIPTYRRTMVYLRYAEALNRAGYPQSAFTILKHGICQENIVNYVDSHYKTIKKRSGRAVTGLSMGGGHTFGISRLYPETFDYYGLQSAAARVQQNDAKFNAQMSRLFSSKPRLFWIAIGKEDFLIQQNNGLRQYLDEHKYPYEYYENDGGHIWRNWRIYLTMFAQKIFRD